MDPGLPCFSIDCESAWYPLYAIKGWCIWLVPCWNTCLLYEWWNPTGNAIVCEAVSSINADRTLLVALQHTICTSKHHWYFKTPLALHTLHTLFSPEQCVKPYSKYLPCAHPATEGDNTHTESARTPEKSLSALVFTSPSFAESKGKVWCTPTRKKEKIAC